MRNLRGAAAPEARAIIETKLGEEAQVDYGTGPMVRDPDTGKYRRTRLFVLTLGRSRKSVRLLVFRSSARVWAELHEKAFRRLGGSPRIVVLDNLREGVLSPDFYDPGVNPLYRDVLAHYGVTALPCKVRDPDRKGKIESAVGHTQKTPLKGKRFESLEEAQAYLDHWEEHWADTRIHGRTKRQVAAMFAEEKPSLQVLPLDLIRMAYLLLNASFGVDLRSRRASPILWLSASRPAAASRDQESRLPYRRDGTRRSHPCWDRIATRSAIPRHSDRLSGRS